MAERLVLCSGCGTKNRVPLKRKGQPKCGSCGMALAVQGHSAFRFAQFAKPVLLVAAGAIALTMYLTIGSGDRQSSVKLVPVDTPPSFAKPDGGAFAISDTSAQPPAPPPRSLLHRCPRQRA